MKKAGRWKLWHLSAVVAAAAPVLAVAVRMPGAMAAVAAVVLMNLIFVPPLWAASAWDWRFRSLLGISPSRPGSVEANLVVLAWFVILLIPHALVIVVPLAYLVNLD
jgi:hypothetical protein